MFQHRSKKNGKNFQILLFLFSNHCLLVAWKYFSCFFAASTATVVVDDVVVIGLFIHWISYYQFHCSFRWNSWIFFLLLLLLFWFWFEQLQRWWQTTNFCRCCSWCYVIFCHKKNGNNDWNGWWKKQVSKNFLNFKKSWKNHWIFFWKFISVHHHHHH